MFGPPKVQHVLILSNFFVALSFTLVTLRMYTRHIIIRAAGIEDYLICVSLSAAIGFLIVEMFQIKYGLGQHLADISDENKVKFFKCLWATIPVYNFSLTFCKLSIIFQYKHVFAVPTVQKICKYFLCFLVVYGLWTVLGSVFMCVPVSFFWGEGKGSCMNRLAFWFSNAALNITTDILIISIPMPLIKKLQIPFRQKLVLMVVFAFGTFVCITSIIRLRSLLSISTSADTTYDGTDIALWSNIEINMAIICSSIPALKPLVSAVFPKLLGKSSLSNSRSNGYGERIDSHPMQSLRSGNRDGLSSGNHGRAIFVEQTFEVRDDGDGKHSREGSERNLVTSVEVPAKSLPFD